MKIAHNIPTENVHQTYFLIIPHTIHRHSNERVSYPVDNFGFHYIYFKLNRPTSERKNVGVCIFEERRLSINFDGCVLDLFSSLQFKNIPVNLFLLLHLLSRFQTYTKAKMI